MNGNRETPSGGLFLLQDFEAVDNRIGMPGICIPDKPHAWGREVLASSSERVWLAGFADNGGVSVMITKWHGVVKGVDYYTSVPQLAMEEITWPDIVYAMGKRYQGYVYEKEVGNAFVAKGPEGKVMRQGSYKLRFNAQLTVDMTEKMLPFLWYKRLPAYLFSLLEFAGSGMDKYNISVEYDKLSRENRRLFSDYAVAAKAGDDQKKQDIEKEHGRLAREYFPLMYLSGSGSMEPQQAIGMNYIAGAFDSAGSIGAGRDGVVVSITLPQFQFARFLLKQHGGSIKIELPGRKTRTPSGTLIESNKPSVAWHVTAKKATRFLETIREHLWFKRELAEAALMR